MHLAPFIYMHDVSVGKSTCPRGCVCVCVCVCTLCVYLGSVWRCYCACAFHLCVCVCMCVHVCLSGQVHVPVCVYLCVSLCVRWDTCMWLCVCVCVSVWGGVVQLQIDMFVSSRWFPILCLVLLFRRPGPAARDGNKWHRAEASVMC